MTAEQAVRQGPLAARNIAASLGHGKRRPYRHRDLGFVVDLAGVKAAANPLGVPLSGLLAKIVTRGYHLIAIPTNRIRIAVDWLLDAILRRQVVQLGLVRGASVPLGNEASRFDGREGLAPEPGDRSRELEGERSPAPEDGGPSGAADR